ncbi:conserved hypothetical protein [Ricinus communis]|uniref:Uncharacterized protein n=1 Tax=Ricinus communis TaxID=3988 RepID=B9SLD8_RICCO|nr:conserved hypothetical protein [Ricinus communis]
MRSLACQSASISGNPIEFHCTESRKCEGFKDCVEDSSCVSLLSPPTFSPASFVPPPIISTPPSEAPGLTQSGVISNSSGAIYANTSRIYH